MANTKWRYRTEVSRTKDGSIKFDRQLHIYEDQWKTVERYILADWKFQSKKTPKWVNDFIDNLLTPEERHYLRTITAEMDLIASEPLTGPFYVDPTKPIVEFLRGERKAD